MIYVPPEFYKESDGASVPLWWRRRVVKRYGQEMMDRIDKAGVVHDYLANSYPLYRAWTRYQFKLTLQELEVPYKLIFQLVWGLKFYDCSPYWLRSLLKKTTK